MTDKELRKLSRNELLEMLTTKTEENEVLKSKLAKISKKLSERIVKSDEPGSMAEIAMKVTGVFKCADDAAALYLKSVKEMTEDQKEVCWKMAEDAKAESKAIHEEADRFLKESEQSKKQAEELVKENEFKKQNLLDLENILKEKITKAEKVSLLAESKLEEFVSKLSVKQVEEVENDSQPEKEETHHKRVEPNKGTFDNEKNSSITECKLEKQENISENNNEKISGAKKERRRKSRN